MIRKLKSKLSKGIKKAMPDKMYLRMMFKKRMGRKLNLDNPETFNEKLQWLKLYNRKPEYTTMVDKYEAKAYVSGIIGEEYIIPTLGIWDSADDIDFDALPNQFVLKCTHDSGGLVICRDKSTLDIPKAINKLKQSLSRNFFWYGREWPYKNVKPRIIAETYMKDSNTDDLQDYKFYCFSGEPRFLYLSRGLEHHDTAKISYVTLDWEIAPFKRTDFDSFEQLPERPYNFDKMISMARILSKNIPYVRIDFYEINKKLYFSEITFFPGSGYTAFVPEEWDYKIGSWLTLPQKSQ